MLISTYFLIHFHQKNPKIRYFWRFGEIGKIGDFGVILGRQDKGVGQNHPKSLSAHRFFRDTPKVAWDSESAESPMPPEKNAGPRPQKGYF